MLYFFLSYAREDDPAFIRRFFEDLSSQVRNLAGADRDDAVGFLDEYSIHLGQRWEMELADALATCRCFVALTSPRYFRRDHCGREWRAFHNRLLAYEKRWNRSAPALLPIQWIPANPLHPIALEIQKSSPELGGDAYEEYGLRQLLDLKRFRDDYRAFVFVLARQIVATAHTHDVPRPRPRPALAELTSMFAPPPAPQPGTLIPAARRPTLTARRSSARRHVHFVIVAGSRQEMSTSRRMLHYYGSDRLDWAPYRPAVDDALGAYASRIADERSFDCEVVGIDNLRRRMAEARERNEVVILLVDTWSLALTEHREAVCAYDAQDAPTAALMIPFNRRDGETIADTTVLQARLADVLPRSLQRRDRVMLRQNVATPDQFCTSLEQILEVARNRIFKKGVVGPQLSRRPQRSRPILDGPMGADKDDQ